VAYRERGNLGKSLPSNSVITVNLASELTVILLEGLEHSVHSCEQGSEFRAQSQEKIQHEFWVIS
jgi:hypothetical protein